jgi:hypothetical protein
VHEVLDRGRQREQQPVDDWLGDLSDADWDEGAAERARATPAGPQRRPPEGGIDEGLVETSARASPAVATDAHRARIERRRMVAALALLLLVALGAAASVLLLRDGSEAPVTTGPESPDVITSDLTDTSPATTSTTPTTPNDGAATFTLPEGTKLQRGESVGDSDLTVSTDPELIAELQRALAAAGFPPGPADGVFGERTQAAVVAFQQANGLPVDGIVGPETAEALNSASAAG